MNRSVRKFGLPATCIGAFLLTWGAARGAHAACNNASTTWANRDDDGDGFCNNVDLCPYDFDTTNNGASCKMTSIATPWLPSSLTAPHSTYTGASILVTGIARYGGTWYRWDFGDNSSTAYAAIGNAYDLSVAHTYTGTVGRLFIATLYVASGGTISSPTNVATSNFYVQIQDTALNKAQVQMASADADVLVNMAQDRGLWYLHQQMGRGTYADGANGYAQPWGYMDGGAMGPSCAAADAFQLHGSTMQNFTSRYQDPYQEDTQRLLAFMFANTQIVGIGTKTIPTGGVDARFGLTTDIGNGVRFGGDDTYTNGICAVSMGSGLSGGVITKTGPTDVYNVSYASVMQRVVDWFAYYQHSPNDTYRGGWWYASNSNGADGSTNQWPILGMTQGISMGVQPPAFVKQETPFFIANTEHTAADTYQGGWGYTNNSVGDYLNMSKAAAGMLEHYFVGDSTSQLEVKRGMGFMYRHWNDLGDNTDSCWNVFLSHFYTMYGEMKSMRVPSPSIAKITELNISTGVQTSNNFDWFYTPIGQSQEGLGTWMVVNQQSDGHWNPGGCDVSTTHATAWATLILNKGVTNIPPTAAICNCGAQWDINSPVTFDGSCSSDSSPGQSIAKYEWDFNYNGSTFNATTVSGYPTTQPLILNQNGYSFYTEDHNGNPLSGVTAPVVALRVTDTTPAAQGGPLKVLTSCSVNIKPPPHCPNVVSGGPYLAAVNVAFTTDAGASFDVDNDPLTFAWDFHNNGAFTDGTGQTSSWTFSLPGTYVIAVAGTDHPESNAIPYNPCAQPDGGTNGCSAPYSPPHGDCTQTSFTTVQVGAHQPVAKAGGPYTSVPNNTITLDGSGSTDPDGLTLTYAWDLTGQGLYTDSTAVKPSFHIGAEAVGTSHQVCLKVNNGAQTSKPSCAQVTVIAQQVAPICDIIAPTVVAVCNGGSQVVNVDGSGSYDVNGDALTYSWTNTCTGATVDKTNASLINFTFNTLNEGCNRNCTTTLTVNNGFFTSSCSATININDTAAPVFSSTPSNITLECTPTTTAQVNTWLANIGAGDNCAPAGSTVGITNNFTANGGCGGVGVGQTKTVTWTAQNQCTSTSTSTKSATVTVVDTTKPVLSLPAPITLEATGPSTPVTYTATSTDFVSGSPTVTCPAHPSGSGFPVGTTTVNCSATDGAGNTQTGSFTVTITDTTPPAITVPANQTLEATSGAGAPFTFTATATDLVNGSRPVNCSPPSGSTFGINATTSLTTTVTCTSSDAATPVNTATKTFTVTVQDTTGPTVTVPGNISVEATGPLTTVSYNVSATDTVDGTIPGSSINCTNNAGLPAQTGNSQSLNLPVGVTNIICIAHDQHGNVSTAPGFNIQVKDTTAPVFTGPAQGSTVTVEAQNASGTQVTTYNLTASDLVSGNTTVNCNPALPHTFAIATTPVTCTSTDAAGNTATRNFSIAVVDTTPPAITCPSNLTVMANGPLGAEAWGVNEPTSNSLATFFAQASTTDLVDPLPSLTNNAPALFPVGQTTTVTFTAKDAHLNANTCQATVSVTTENEPPPTLNCPTNVTLASTDSASINWVTAFRRPVSVQLAVISAPSAGNALTLSEASTSAALLSSNAASPGTYAVRLRATDDISGAAVECNRLITVNGAGMQLAMH